MVFSSLTFLTLFLPCVLLGYYLCFSPVSSPARADAARQRANFFLLMVSLFFYFWGEGSQIWILVSSCAGNFFIARWMVRRCSLRGKGAAAPGFECADGLAPGGGRTKSQKALLAAAIVLNIGGLAYCKYGGFLVDNFARVFPFIRNLPSWGRVSLPLGISFFTFQALSYVIDVYRGAVRPDKSLVNFSCYLTFFPQLVAGPIIRYHDVCRQLAERTFSRSQFASGVRRFVLGLSKKVLIANAAAILADRAFDLAPQQLTVGAAWMGLLGYSIQIYFDFSGYSDMAIGLGRMFGFEFMENFNYPYIARSVHDFWRRWHISLSTWFRDYLYRPLGGNRKGPGRTYLNLFAVFFLCGLWHGASWTFVAWGLYHGIFLILERFFPRGWKVDGRADERRRGLTGFCRHVYVLLMVMGGWVLFRAGSFEHAWGYYGALFGSCQGSGAANVIWLYGRSWEVRMALAAGVLFSMPLIRIFRRWRDALRCVPAGKPGAGFILICAELGPVFILLGLLALCFLPLSSGTYNPFIYFRF